VHPGIDESDISFGQQHGRRINTSLCSSIDPGWVPAIAERAPANGMHLSGHLPAFLSAEQAVRAGYDAVRHIITPGFSARMGR
jgi:hypothetical protein